MLRTISIDTDEIVAGASKISVDIKRRPEIRRELKIVPVFQNQSIRSRFAELIGSIEVKAQQGLKIPNYAIQLEHTETLENAADCLSRHFASRDDNAAILISDSLVCQVPKSKRTTRPISSQRSLKCMIPQTWGANSPPSETRRRRYK